MDGGIESLVGRGPGIDDYLARQVVGLAVVDKVIVGDGGMDEPPGLAQDFEAGHTVVSVMVKAQGS